MIKKITTITSLAATSLLLTGCQSVGSFNGGASATTVSLDQANYKIIKAGATGEAAAYRWFGLFPITSPYATAKEELYKSVGENLTGRPIGLANTTWDQTSANLVLFSMTKIKVTADVIEYTK
jgi:hypothetical protein